MQNDKIIKENKQKKKKRRPWTTLTFQSCDSGHQIGSATKIIILKLNSQ
jgi:hypothetical protein